MAAPMMDVPPSDERAPSVDTDAGSRMIVAGFWMFRLSMWATAALLLKPRLLDHVGLRESGHWLATHGWLRGVVFVLLLPFFAFSAFTIRSVRRTRPDDPQTPEEALARLEAAMQPGLGIRDDEPTVRTIEGRRVEIASWRGDGRRRTVVTVTEIDSRGFHFAMSPAFGALGPLQGVAKSAIAAGLDRALDDAPGATPGLRASLDFLAQDPVANAEGFDVRANDAARAQALLADPEVRSALARLAEQSRPSWSLLPEGAGSGATLRVECAGGPERDGRAETLEALVRATLRRLPRA